MTLSQPVTAQIKTLIMPGELVQSHADIEPECGNCHEAFERDKQRALCLDCHEEIADDISAGLGYHGLFPDAKQGACASCHTDHDGRGADIVNLDEQRFDHDFTDFALQGKHREPVCSDCHERGQKHRDAPQGCNDCHAADNVHESFLSDDCGDCHTPLEWQDAEFDHDVTDFSLLGRHQEVGCLDCHDDQTFQNAPTTCFGCHASDDAHEGRSGENCGNCHNSTDWLDTSFDHERDTQFAVDGQHATLSCGDCHSDDPFADALQSDCLSCHIEDDSHDGHFGADCDSCHTTETWALVAFDHDFVTGHSLNDAHASIECEACHIEPIFDVSLQGDCSSCHVEDDAHEGTQGTSCTDCHNESSWQDDVFFDHDLTQFPLLGKHSGEQCESCHESHVFRDASTECVDCHRQDDIHDNHFGGDCGLCHNPVDWRSWQFDHSVQTQFPLQNAHAEVACESCHRGSLAIQTSLNGRCADCHRSDDVHDGEFGLDCARCHTTDTFRDVRSIR